MLASEGPVWAIWFWFTCLIAIVWLRRHLDLRAARHEAELDPAEPGVGDADLPSVSMLVAGKDEEANIERCVDGLLAQQYPKLEVIVINDRSADRTGAIVDELAANAANRAGAATPTLRVIHIRDLPGGWFGKNHAMHVGVQQAQGDWLCFSDADCVFENPHLISAALRYALREKIALLSVLPRLEVGTFWERVVQPAAGGIMVFWFPPQRVNNPRSRAAYANGAFMLLSRQTYATLGGHAAVKATLNEDMHFARRCKQMGLRLHVIRGGHLYHVRMYVGFQQVWRGWSRIFYGCFGTLGRLLGSALMLLVFSLSPYLTLLSGMLAGDAWLVGAGGAAVLAQQSVLWRFYPQVGSSAPWALTYPLGAIIAIGMLINATRRLFGRQTTWRGTSYAGGS